MSRSPGSYGTMDIEPHSEGLRRIIELSRLGVDNWIVRVQRHCDNPGLRDQLVEQAQWLRNFIKLPKKTTPVALPPAGRLRLATRPRLTGSPLLANTIGIVEVAAFAASAPGVVEAIAATWRPTSSAVSIEARSNLPSNQ